MARPTATTLHHPAPAWQGLSDNEINSIKLLGVGKAIIRAIEQALKEKNDKS
jgi:hypothetical protein